MLVVEADNALGSARGDVDDGFALAGLLGHAAGAGFWVSTYGNTSEEQAACNNRALAALAGTPVRHLRGCARRGQSTAEAVEFLCAAAGARVLALGPLTTVAAALARAPDLDLAEVVLVGGDTRSRGWLPPLWPHEFNFWLDRPAARAVFASRLPLTLVPIDVGRRLLLPRPFVDALPGPLGAHLRRPARRRLARNRRWLGIDALRGYDVLAAGLVYAPEAVQCAPLRAGLHRRGFLQRGRGRELRVVVDFDGPRLLAALAASVRRAGAPRSLSPP